LNVVIDPELARRPMVGAAGRLGQILINLVGNAIKFTIAGAVTVRVGVIEEEAEELLIRIEVQDTGIGISESDQQRLFRMFEQVDMSLTRPFGGAGLGLYIARRLAERMGGAIGVSSRPGSGSTFWFTVRLRKGSEREILSADLDADEAEARLRRMGAGARVLLVEDEALNREWVADALQSAGLQVDSAEDGRQAVEMASRIEYAVIVMDVKMPEMDGLEATRRIRALAGRGKVPIVALTALAYPEDRARCNRASPTRPR
jgi:CheY-like chemotaxis protein